MMFISMRNMFSAVQNERDRISCKRSYYEEQQNQLSGVNIGLLQAAEKVAADSLTMVSVTKLLCQGYYQNPREASSR